MIFKFKCLEVSSALNLGTKLYHKKTTIKLAFLWRTLFVSQLVTFINDYSEPCCMVYKNALRGTSLERQ